MFFYFMKDVIVPSCFLHFLLVLFDVINISYYSRIPLIDINYI